MAGYLCLTALSWLLAAPADWWLDNCVWPPHICDPPTCVTPRGPPPPLDWFLLFTSQHGAGSGGAGRGSTYVYCHYYTWVKFSFTILKVWYIEYFSSIMFVCESWTPYYHQRGSVSFSWSICSYYWQTWWSHGCLINSCVINSLSYSISHPLPSTFKNTFMAKP